MLGMLLALTIVLIECVGGSIADDLCQRCECLPTQVICRTNDSAPKAFFPTTTESNRETLELVYIYGIEVVNFEENSFPTKKPVTILIQNCTNVNIYDGAIDQLRTLVIRDAKNVRLGILNHNVLWATLLENIDELTLDSNSLSANYSVSIGHVGSLTIHQRSNGTTCSGSNEFTFHMYNCKVKPIHHGGMSLCSGYITIDSNTFELISEEGLQITTEGTIAIINNHFQNLQKQSFNLSSPEIHIYGNQFDHLPAGSLRGISTFQDTFFINNSIKDIDLGGVLLDMGWDMVVENNVIQCDCASKRTSILNPKQDMLYLTNSSLEKLHTNFMNNFCNLNCTVSLEMFSYALSQGNVCFTNSTQLEQDLLCNITIEEKDSTNLWNLSTEPEIETNTTPFGTNPPPGNHSFAFSSATKIEFLVPISIVLLTLLITTSICYGCREMYTFKFTFSPNRLQPSKVTQQ